MLVERDDLPGAVDMAADQMPVDAVAQAHAFFEVDLAQTVQARGLGQGFGRDIDAEIARRLGRDGHAGAVDCDRIADRDIVEPERGRFDGQAFAKAQLFGAHDRARRLDDAGEHETLLDLRNLALHAGQDAHIVADAFDAFEREPPPVVE